MSYANRGNQTKRKWSDNKIFYDGKYNNVIKMVSNGKNSPQELTTKSKVLYAEKRKNLVILKLTVEMSNMRINAAIVSF